MTKTLQSLPLAIIVTLTPAAAFACLHMMPKSYFATHPLDYSIGGVLLATIVAFVMRLREASNERILAWWCSSVIAGVGVGFFAGSHVALQLSGMVVTAVVAAVPSLLVIRARTRLGAVIPLLMALFIAGAGTWILIETRNTYNTYSDSPFQPRRISEDVVF